MTNFDKENHSRTSKSLGLEVDYFAQEVKYPSFQLHNQPSSLTESTGLSHPELNAMGKTSSQDQCASSDSAHDESYGRRGQDTKPGLFMCNPELSMNASQAEICQPIVQFPYAYPDPYLSGLFTAYGPHTMIQPQVMAAVSGRVPLPADIPEDGPIYVNAKQYHGILRRRQTRAKLEAQNKLVKNRRPYLHESRHQHALNRVRGTGGRFLSTKKSQQSDSQTSSQSASDSYNLFKQNGNTSYANEHLFESNKHEAPSSTCEGNSRVFEQQADGGRYSSIPSHMAIGNGGLVYNGNGHYASIVR